MIKPTFVLNRATVVPPNFYHKCVSRILSTGEGHVGGACMAGGGGVHGGGWQGVRVCQEKRQLQWAVRILLECILVINGRRKEAVT